MVSQVRTSKDVSGRLPLAAFGCRLLLLVCPDAEAPWLLDELASLNRLTTKLETKAALTGDENRFLKEALYIFVNLDDTPTVIRENSRRRLSPVLVHSPDQAGEPHGRGNHQESPGGRHEAMTRIVSNIERSTRGLLSC